PGLFQDRGAGLVEGETSGTQARRPQARDASDRTCPRWEPGGNVLSLLGHLVPAHPFPIALDLEAQEGRLEGTVQVLDRLNQLIGLGVVHVARQGVLDPPSPALLLERCQQQELVRRLTRILPQHLAPEPELPIASYPVRLRQGRARS